MLTLLHSLWINQQIGKNQSISHELYIESHHETRLSNIKRDIFSDQTTIKMSIYIAMAMKPIHDYIGEFCFSPRVLLKTNKSD